jgi:pimeloyl-ACP methyl ester carboxylesterase
MVTVQERTLSVWGGQIQPRVKIAGDGPPLVFFHGAYGLAWDPFLDGLAQGRTVYAPEHPGTTPGDPDAIRPLDNLWDLVLYYYELFDQLGLEAPDVVGHSFGGMVAAEVAATNPDRVGRMVLLNPLGLWRDDAPVKNWMSMPQEAVAKAAFYDPEGPIAKQAFALPEDPEAMADAQVLGIWTLACTGKFVWPIPDKGLKKRIHRIKAPTLIIWGQQDALAPPVYAQEFADRIAGARVELVDQAAHVPHLEQPDTVGKLVQDFLKS